MDKLIIIGFIVGALILALIINFVGEKKKVKDFEKKLKANFGKLARKEYDPEKKNSYRAYYKKHQNDNSFSPCVLIKSYNFICKIIYKIPNNKGRSAQIARLIIVFLSSFFSYSVSSYSG